MSTRRAKRELKEGFERGCNIVDFSGGEPTLRKDLPNLVAFAKKLGYETIGITTNGRMMSYPEILKRITKAGLNSVVFSVHGDEMIHDFLTRTRGSYSQLVKGINNFKKISPDSYVCTNTVITNYNYKKLPAIAENNIKLGADGCEFIFPHPKGNSLKNFDTIVPKLEDISCYIDKTLDVGKMLEIRHFYFRYFPLCYMSGNEGKLSEYSTSGIFIEEHVGPDFKDLNVEKGRKEIGRVKGDVCKNCILNDDCEGIFKEYAKKRGFGELKPVFK